MEITTNAGNIYSYLPINNEIVAGTVAENKIEWRFNPLNLFNSLPEVRMFIIGITEQCNLRCSYCCYSGKYTGKRSHGTKSVSNVEIESVVEFIDGIAGDRPKRIAFYGGEPMLNFNTVRYCIGLCRFKWGHNVSFSISTNGTMLKPEEIDWFMENDVEIAVSLDGPKFFHDKNRVFANGSGSFDHIRKSIEYIYSHYRNPNVSFHITLANVRDLIAIAKAWHEDELLSGIFPTMVHGLTPNFEFGVNRISYPDVKGFYSELIDAYQQHPDWLVLKVFLEEAISAWKERMIFEINESIEISTCLPVNTKLYIDSNLGIAVCEKFSDNFRIGDVGTGIDWDKANHLVKEYYKRKKERCSNCPIVRICDICLTAIEYTQEQMEIICHNEMVYARVSLYTFCEMVERGLVQ